MKDKIEEARDLIAGLIDRPDARYPVSLIRIHHLLEQVLRDWWGDDDTTTLPLCFPDNDFPAA